MADYYRILGISPIADEKQIRAAYRRLARQYHPDAGPGSSAETFRAVQDAYELLSDPEKRREYDESREAEFRARSRSYVPGHFPRSSHIDLRDIVGSRQRSTGIQTEPMRGFRRRDGVDDPFEALLEQLLRDFGF